ncbi:MAG: alpha/beta hydrolase, partial [Dehalococcoidia bacterium]|nr:alpha/beta hydrolase [Dehalococcoidia bacterium]
MKRAYVDIPEGQIHYQTRGAGEPLLLLHQTPLSSDEYTNLMPLLVGSRTVIAMDTLGYGKSDRPPRRYGMPEYAQSVAGFVKALGLTRVSVFGHHTGASIAVELAAAHPGLVDKLVISGCPSYSPEALAKRLKSPSFVPMKPAEDGSHVMKVWQDYSAVFRHPSPEDMQLVFESYMIAGTGAEDAHAAVFSYDVAKRLPLISCPTLLISGTKDFFLDRLEVTARLIPRCRTAIIEGGGPLLTVQMAKEMAQ